MIEIFNLKRFTAAHAEEIQSAVRGVIDSGWYLRGEATKAFETAYANYIGTRYCVGCGNGLDALTLILRSYVELGRMNKGDEVIVPANTYIASMLAITRCGLTPVLVEPDIETFQMDENRIEQAITERTRAVMIVHLYGRCAYTELVGELCRKRNLILIEDNAQAHGCTYVSPSDGKKSRMTGSLGHSAAHSFYPTKNLGALGDAGAITTDDAEVAEMARGLGNYGSARKYVFDHIGVNSRLDEVQAAILNVKLRYLDEDNRRRKENALYYINNVCNPLIKLPSMDYWDKSVFHIFPVLTPKRDELKRYLAENGVQTETHYPIPPHKQRCYKQWNALSLPVTERIHREELSIPVSHVVTQEERETIVKLLNSFR